MGSRTEKGFGQSDPQVIAYAHRVFQPEDEVLRFVREESRRKGLPDIEVGSFDGLHLEVLVRMVAPSRVIEIGTLGGYSGIRICRGLAPGGRLHTFELDPRHAEVARANFDRAGVGDRVTIHVGPALENLAKVEREAPFDLVFIDADKGRYPDYLRWATDHLRMGGTVIADNTFGWGQIGQDGNGPASADGPLAGLRRFNEMVAVGGRFAGTILPTAEGLTVAVKVR